HLLESDERHKPIKLDDLWVDIGAKDKKSAQELVAIGDCVTYAQELQRLQGDICTARSFDNKMALFVLVETMRLLADRELKAAVFAVSNVQEEIGLRGARTASFG